MESCSQVRDGDQVMVCLKRALKIAHAAQQQLAIAMRQSDTMPAALFVEILNHYLYYFDQGLTLINSTVLQVRLEVQIDHLNPAGAHAYVQLSSACEKWSCAFIHLLAFILSQSMG